MTWPNHPTDASGRFVITDEIHGPCSANVVHDNFGEETDVVYLDDSTPDLEKWLWIAVGSCHHSVILVSVPPGPPPRPRHTGTGVWNMLEVYWWGFGRDVQSWYEPLPNYGAYIVQWDYLGPFGKNPIPQNQKNKWLAAAQAKRPKFGVWKF